MLWNPWAERLIEWAAEENNRLRTQKLVKIAEKIERQCRLHYSVGGISDAEVYEECKKRYESYKMSLRLREICRT